MAPIPTPSTGTTGKTSTAAAVAATVQTMVICVPDELPSESLSTRQLERHFGVRGTLQARFWASAMYLWQRGQMFDLRSGTRPAYCAGGPVRLLNLTGMSHAAAIGAGIRHQMWTAAVHGTRPAEPWAMFEAKNLQRPASYPIETAIADFHGQPRINAMRMHNARHTGAVLALDELEMYQAGQQAYQHYWASAAIVGDALLTADGEQLVPESDAMANRVTYLEKANRYLKTLEDSQRLLAVAL